MESRYKKQSPKKIFKNCQYIESYFSETIIKMFPIPKCHVNHLTNFSGYRSKNEEIFHFGLNINEGKIGLQMHMSEEVGEEMKNSPSFKWQKKGAESGLCIPDLGKEASKKFMRKSSSL